MAEFQLPARSTDPTEGPYIKADSNAPLNFISEQDSRGKHQGQNPWDPQVWVDKGYTRNWGDAAVMSPFFEVLRRDLDGVTSFVVLCPTFLRRPLVIEGDWGGY